MTRTRALISWNFLLLSVLLSGCSSDKPTEPQPVPRPLTNVTLVPAGGPPGTPVVLEGMPPLADTASWELKVAGQTVPLITSGSGSPRMVIPLLYSPADSTWPISFTDPVTVTIWRDGCAVDSLPGALTIELLPLAEGAADDLVQNLAKGLAGIRNLTDLFAPGDTLAHAVLASMDEIISTGDNSITALLDGSAPLLDGYEVPTDLCEAILVSSGTSALVSSWAARLAEPAEWTPSDLDMMRSRLLAGDGQKLLLSGEDLAYDLQLYSLLKEFGTTALGRTAASWNDIATVMGIGQMVRSVPVANATIAVIGFALNSLDFIINKIALGLLPAQITKFDLDFLDHQVAPGDTTSSIVKISAVNRPPDISVNDIIAQVLNALSLTSWLRSSHVPESLIPDPERMRGLIESFTQWTLGVIQGFVNVWYPSQPSLASQLRTITWNDLPLHNPDLVSLISTANNRLTPMAGHLNWRAGNEFGPAKLRLHTAGPNGLIHPTLAGLGYAGGTFGECDTLSNEVEVRVSPDLALEVDFPSSLEVGDVGLLSIRSGYVTASGGTNWTGGIRIGVSAGGGVIQRVDTQTGADGRCSAMIGSDGSSRQIHIVITAAGEEDSFARMELNCAVNIVGGPGPCSGHIMVVQIYHPVDSRWDCISVYQMLETVVLQYTQNDDGSIRDASLFRRAVQRNQIWEPGIMGGNYYQNPGDLTFEFCDETISWDIVETGDECFFTVSYSNPSGGNVAGYP